VQQETVVSDKDVTTDIANDTALPSTCDRLDQGVARLTAKRIHSTSIMFLAVA